MKTVSPLTELLIADVWIFHIKLLSKFVGDTKWVS